MRKLIFLLTLILTLGGCGGGVAPSTNTDTVSPASVPTRVLGRVELDQPMVGARIELYSTDGTVIPTGQPALSDESGLFILSVSDLPSRFRVVATGEVNGVTEAYASDYDTFSANSEMVMVTPLTNLVSAHHDAHPELSLAQSEEAVRSYLQLPAHQTIRHHMVHEGHRPGFKVANFLAHSRSDNNFLARVVQSVDDPISPPIPNSIFSDPTTQFWTDQSIQLGVAVISTVLQASGVPAGALLGWAVNLAVGSSGSDQAALQQLAAEIAALANEINQVYTALSQEILQQSYIDQVNNLISQLDQIQSNRNLMTNLLNNGATQQDIDNFVGAITTPDFIGLLTKIHVAQVGTSAAPGLQAQAAEVVQLTGGPYYGNASQYNALLSEFSYFASQQTSAITMIVEGLHCDSDPSTNPPLATPDPPLAQQLYDQHMQNLAEQAASVPQPLDSDNVILVRPAGLIFYRKAFSRQEYGVATFMAMVFREGNYTNWRVATATDYMALLNALNQPGQNISVDVMQNEGFDFSAATSSTDNPDDSHYFLGLDDGFIGQGFSLDVGTSELARYQLFGGPQWGGYHLPFLIVCDVADQDPSLFPATAAVNDMEVVQNGNRMSAMAHHKLVTGMEPNFFQGTVNYQYGTSSTAVDVTQLVAWSTSDPFTLRIQNPPATTPKNTLKVMPSIELDAGVITWLKAGTVTVTAQLVNTLFDNRPVLAASTTLTNSNVPAPKLLLMRLGPKHATLVNPTVATPLTLYGFYDDGSSKPLTTATFTQSIPEASVSVANGQLFLDLSAVPATKSFTVTATLDGVSDTTTFSLP